MKFVSNKQEEMMTFYYAIIVMMRFIVIACQLNYRKLFLMMRMNCGCVLFAKQNKIKRRGWKEKFVESEYKLHWISINFKLLLEAIFFVPNAIVCWIKDNFVSDARGIFT